MKRLPLITFAVLLFAASIGSLAGCEQQESQRARNDPMLHRPEYTEGAYEPKNQQRWRIDMPRWRSTGRE